ncbi:hypothetical protein HRbin36_02017 [bacterium HR36]|nr:hypothetical protein HRbin36_02017 [bacterium HR36]
MSGETLRLGVLGLGSNWRVWRRALRRSRSCRVEVVFDQVHQQASRESARLHCHLAESVWQLLSWPGIDVVLYCDAQWFGLWPLELALSPRSAGLDAGQAGGTPPEAPPATAVPSQKNTWWSLVPPTVELAKAPGLLEQIVSQNEPVYFLWPEWEVRAARQLCRQARKRLGSLRWLQVQYLGYTSEQIPLVATDSLNPIWRFWCGGLAWLSELQNELAQEVHHLSSLQNGEAQYRSLVARFPENVWAVLETMELLDGQVAARASRTGISPLSWPTRLLVRILGKRGEVMFRWPDTLHWYLGKRQRQERWPSELSLASRLLRQLQNRWQRQEVPSENLRRLKHYCTLLQALERT